MIGQTLQQRYTIKDRLGKGAMGTVYRATDSQTGQDVAIKVISRDLALDADLLERFKREGEALSQLQHPNIVSFAEAFQHDEQHVIVMEYISGGSLHDLIKQGPLPVERARQIALDLCDALIRAHRLNIIHRDLKPENILLAADGTPKLTDFGVARLAEGTRMTGTGTQIGTPFYMSPEAWEGQSLDAQADIWSLGIVLYEMLSGQVPFGGGTLVAVMNKVLTAPLPDLKTRRPDVPPGLADIVARMLARDKVVRYHTMREAAADLERGQTTLPLPPTVAATGVAPAKPARWLPAAIGLGIVAVITVLAIGFVAQTQRAQLQTLTELASAPTATYDINILAIRFADATATDKASKDATRTATASVRLTSLALTPSRTPAPTRTIGPTSTPDPLELGERLESCGSDLCFVNAGGKRIPIGLAKQFIIYSSNEPHYDVSPDGSRVVFSGCLIEKLTSGANCIPDLYVANRDGSNAVHLSGQPDTWEVWPSWSPDGELIIFNSGCDIRIIQPDGTGTKQIASGCLVAEAYMYVWSPDSQHVAWTSGLHSDVGEHNYDRLWVLNRDGSDLRSLLVSNDPNFSGNVAWSPDGQSLAVGFEDGKTYLFSAQCDSTSTGCDRTFAIEIAEIPQDWLHTFRPQWISAYADPQAAVHGCGIEDQLLYAEDFENETAGSRAGNMIVEEAPDGGLALHGNEPGTYLNIVPLDDLLIETRIAFRIMPIRFQWFMSFRDGDEGAGPIRYELIDFGDRLELKQWIGQSDRTLTTAPTFPRQEWSEVEIIWESQNAIAVRRNGEEVIRYEESGDVIDEGFISFSVYGEAWYDDIVICGQG